MQTIVIFSAREFANDNIQRPHRIASTPSIVNLSNRPAATNGSTFFNGTRSAPAAATNNVNGNGGGIRLPTVSAQPAFSFMCFSTYFQVRPLRPFASRSPPFFESHSVSTIPNTDPAVAAATYNGTRTWCRADKPNI